MRLSIKLPGTWPCNNFACAVITKGMAQSLVLAAGLGGSVMLILLTGYCPKAAKEQSVRSKLKIFFICKILVLIINSYPLINLKLPALPPHY